MLVRQNYDVTGVNEARAAFFNLRELPFLMGLRETSAEPLPKLEFPPDQPLTQDVNAGS